MGRGLGPMQREILDTLDEARQAPLRVDGYGYVAPGLGREPGTVSVSGLPPYHTSRVLPLPDEVYDLRASLHFLAARHDQFASPNRHDIDRAFAARFSRAARSLVDRGALLPESFWYQPPAREHCPCCGRPWPLGRALSPFKLRFVSRPDPTI